MNLFGFETLKLKIRRLKLWKPTVVFAAFPELHSRSVATAAVPKASDGCFRSLGGAQRREDFREV